MTVSLDKIITTASVQQANVGASSYFTSVIADKLFVTMGVQQANTDAPTARQNSVILDKLVVTASVQQANTNAPTARQNSVILDKIYVTVAISGPVPGDATSNATGTATGIGSRLYQSIGAASGNTTVVALGANIFTMLPVQDIVQGNWKNENNSTPLYPSVSKLTQNDATYISGEPDGTIDVTRMKLDASPYSNAAALIIKYRLTKYPTISSTPVDLVVTLQQNTTNIATWTHSNVSAIPVIVEHVLSVGQIGTITDLDDLYVVFTSKVYIPPG